MKLLLAIFAGWVNRHRAKAIAGTEERPHQGVGNKLLSPSGAEPTGSGDVVVDERLGGLLRSYRRAA